MRPSVNTLNVSPPVGCGSGINTESEAGISLGYLGSGTARGEGEWVEVGMKMKKKRNKKEGKEEEDGYKKRSGWGRLGMLAFCVRGLSHVSVAHCVLVLACACV